MRALSLTYKKLSILSLFVLCVSFWSSLANASCLKNENAPIKFGSLTWESGQFISAVLQTITEQGYGCKTELVPGAGPALETALAHNDIQVIGEQWIGRSPIMEDALAKGAAFVIGSTLEGGATQGWYVPKYVLEDNPNFRSYQDLLDHATLFTDPEEPSRSRFLNCPSGWTCEVFNTHLIENIGLSKQYNNVHPGTGAALDAEIASAFEQRKSLLFYYWQPTGLMAKYDFAPIAFPAYDSACWDQLLDANSQTDCVSGFPVSELGVAVSTAFVNRYPELVKAFKSVQFTPNTLNRAILEMSENKRSGEEQAKRFLQQNPQVWRHWITPESAQNLAKSLGVSLALEGTDLENELTRSAIEQGLTKPFTGFPEWSFETPLNDTLSYVVSNFGNVFRFVSHVALSYLILPVETLLMLAPPWLIIGFVAVLGWFANRKIWFAAACAGGLFLIGAFGLWAALVKTLALLIVAVFITMIIGVPGAIVICGV